MEIISVECRDEFDPRLIRVLARTPDGYTYSFDIPEPLYAQLLGPFGAPLNPCATN